jgi:pSer/pThr/pTyr-binding forkhead associated (FHA) protein
MAMKAALVLFLPNGERREFRLSNSVTVIGRREDCTLRVPSNDVSRTHCQVAMTNGSVQVRDLGSSNGTYVNNKRVLEAPLKAGDRLRVGPITFTLQIDGKPRSIKPPTLVKKPPAKAHSDDPTRMPPAETVQKPAPVPDDSTIVNKTPAPPDSDIDLEMSGDLGVLPELDESDLQELDISEVDELVSGMMEISPEESDHDFSDLATDDKSP